MAMAGLGADGSGSRGWILLQVARLSSTTMGCSHGGEGSREEEIGAGREGREKRRRGDEEEGGGVEEEGVGGV
eukprot:766898-Hanusia_phi.AAC.4